MTNNTEQRRAFEEWLKTVLSPIPEMGYEDEAKDLALLAWQAALAQREQVGDSSMSEKMKLVPVDATPEMVAAAYKVDMANEDVEGFIHNTWHSILAAAPKQDESTEHPCDSLAESSCTAEEAAELLKDIEREEWFTTAPVTLSLKELSLIINADRAKR
jgi:hypothetical protein